MRQALQLEEIGMQDKDSSLFCHDCLPLYGFFRCIHTNRSSFMWAYVKGKTTDW